MPNDYLKLAIKAKQLRIKKGMPIEGLAKAAKINKNTVLRFEKGFPTTLETITKICNVLGVSPFSLLDQEPILDQDYHIVQIGRAHV